MRLKHLEKPEFRYSASQVHMLLLKRTQIYSLFLALIPVLILIGAGVRTVFSLTALLIISELLIRSAGLGDSFLWNDPIFMLVISLSILGFVTGVTESFAVGLISISICAIGSIAVSRFRAKKLRYLGIRLPNTPESALPIALLFAASLAVLGWSSLWFYVIGLVIAVLMRLKISSNNLRRYPYLFIPVGFAISFNQLKHSGGQFWLSFDQLYRSSLAAGLARWGVNDHIGATGSSVNYHWLGESVAGVLGRLMSTSAIEATTRTAPAVGVLLCLRALVKLGRQFGFRESVSMIAALVTVATTKSFEIYSLGSLWGIGLLLLGLGSIEHLRHDLRGNRKGLLNSFAAVLLLTPLITMTQASLGIHFVFLTVLIIGWSAIRDLRMLLTFLSIVGLQSLVLWCLGQTLLQSKEGDIYQPTISVRNVLQFRGVDIYLGSREAYVLATSVIYLLVISQALIGFFFTRQDSNSDRRALSLAGFVGIASLVLANLMSIGGPEAQQARFLVPIIAFGAFLSVAFLLRRTAAVIASRTFTSRNWSVSALVACLVGLLLLLGKWYSDDLSWSRERTIYVVLTVFAGQILWLLVLIFNFRGSRPYFFTPLVIALSFFIILTADGQQVAHVRNIHQLTVGYQRAEPFLGSEEAQECLRVVVQRTSSDSIIASNWYEIPHPSVQQKYFLVTANTQRRSFVDGPNYVRNPRPNWLEQRVAIVEEFAEEASFKSYEELRNADVEYFVVRHGNPMPASWEPYARIILKNEICSVLELYQ